MVERNQYEAVKERLKCIFFLSNVDRSDVSALISEQKKLQSYWAP